MLNLSRRVWRMTSRVAPRDRAEEGDGRDLRRPESPHPEDVGQGVDRHRPESDHRWHAHVEHVLEDAPLGDVDLGADLFVLLFVALDLELFHGGSSCDTARRQQTPCPLFGALVL